MHFYELHEGDNEVFADLLLAREEEMEAEEFFDVVQSIRRRVVDNFETQTLVEAIADELERDYGFIAVTDERLTAAVNVSREEEENFLADLDAPDDSMDYASILADLQAEGIRTNYVHQHAMVVALSAKIEMELGELDPEEAGVFMEELGLTESALDRVIALSYKLVGLISFLTAGPDEVRAWPIPDGSNAVDAAGAIHTDLARGFIRAETIAYEDLLSLGSMAEAKKHGKVRSEGKTYRVRDGDVVEILFSR